MDGCGEGRGEGDEQEIVSAKAMWPQYWIVKVTHKPSHKHNHGANASNIERHLGIFRNFSDIIRISPPLCLHSTLSE